MGNLVDSLKKIKTDKGLKNVEAIKMEGNFPIITKPNKKQAKRKGQTQIYGLDHSKMTKHVYCCFGKKTDDEVPEPVIIPYINQDPAQRNGLVRLVFLIDAWLYLITIAVMIGSLHIEPLQQFFKTDIAWKIVAGMGGLITIISLCFCCAWPLHVFPTNWICTLSLSLCFLFPYMYLATFKWVLYMVLSILVSLTAVSFGVFLLGWTQIDFTSCLISAYTGGIALVTAAAYFAIACFVLKMEVIEEESNRQLVIGFAIVASVLMAFVNTKFFQTFLKGKTTLKCIRSADYVFIAFFLYATLGLIVIMMIFCGKRRRRRRGFGSGRDDADDDDYDGDDSGGDDGGGSDD